ncbi:MAG: AI-2E family transporter [Alphaproteobacteria bacterium]|nr:AI-2E family transporter [Alphaproteobacteria bacterium]
MKIERQAFFWLMVAALFFFLIDQLKEILLPFVVGIGFAYGLNPVADMLERKGVSRAVASILLVSLLIIFFVLLVVFLAPVVIAQASQFMEALPGELVRLRGLMETWARDNLGQSFPQAEQSIGEAVNWVSENSGTVASWVAQSVWTQGRALFAIVSLLLIAPLVTFYLLIDWKRMLAEVDNALPREHADTLRSMGRDINAAVGAFVRGQGTVCLVLGLFYALGLWLVGLDYGVLIGFATGLMAFVPFLGWIVGTITATTLAVIQFWPHWFPVILVVCVFLAGQALDAGFLSPKVVGPKIGLHPVWLIFALFAFSYLFGLVGTLVAVPMAAAVGVIVRYSVRAYRASSVYTGDVPVVGDGSDKV